jgi:hypothetical protein
MVIQPSDRTRVAPAFIIVLYTIQHASIQNRTSLQLGPRLRLLQYRVQFRRLHHIALNLQFSAHEQLLRIRLALH